MGSLIDELQRREAAARQEAEELRERIAQLTERLAQAEERLSRLVITRETVDEVLNGSGTEAVLADGVAPSRAGRLSAVGVLAVPPWQAGLEASALPQGYRDLLEVLEDAGRPLRAGQVAAAAGLGTGKAKVEGVRSKLKRLAGRGWLAEEAGPGLPWTKTTASAPSGGPAVSTGDRTPRTETSTVEMLTSDPQRDRLRPLSGRRWLPNQGIIRGKREPITKVRGRLS